MWNNIKLSSPYKGKEEFQIRKLSDVSTRRSLITSEQQRQLINSTPNATKNIIKYMNGAKGDIFVDCNSPIQPVYIQMNKA